MNDRDIQQIAAIVAATNQQMQMQTGFKHTLAGAVGGGVAPYGHGQGGLFATPGVDNNVFSAMQLPMFGLIDRLPLRTGDMPLPFDGDFGGVEQPLFDIITGVTEGDSESLANQRNDRCDPAPTGGLMKVGTVTAPYGEFSQRVRQLDITRMSQLLRGNNAEVPNRVLVNNPFAAGNRLAPQLTQGSPLVNELQRRIVESAVSWKRYMSRKMWDGTPANNTAGGGYREFVGWQTIVNTGNKVDAFTAQVLTAADSVVYEFANSLVDGTVRNIVDYVEQMLENLEYQARTQGFSTVEHVVVMNPNLWRQLTKVWPVYQYQNALTAIAAFANGRAVVDARDATAIRDDMRANMFLPVNGRILEVVLDDGIPENDSTNADLAAGVFSSDIYFIPLTANGQVVSYIDPFNYDNAQFSALNQLGFATTHIRVTDGGRFLWTSNVDRQCIEIEWNTIWRPICRTPYLAGRINDVAYQPLRHFRSPYPDSPYFRDGGRTNTAEIGIYTDWSNDTPVVIGG